MRMHGEQLEHVLKVLHFSVLKLCTIEHQNVILGLEFHFYISQLST